MIAQSLAIAWAGLGLWWLSPLPYSFDIFILNDTKTRSIFLGFAFFLVFLFYPPSRPVSSKPISGLDVALAIAGTFCGSYLILFYDSPTVKSLSPDALDLASGVLGLFILMEAVRRSVALPIAVIGALALLYVFAAIWLPVGSPSLNLSVTKIVNHLWLTTEGVYGIFSGNFVTYFFPALLLATFVDRSGLLIPVARFSFRPIARILGIEGTNGVPAWINGRTACWFVFLSTGVSYSPNRLSFAAIFNSGFYWVAVHAFTICVLLALLYWISTRRSKFGGYFVSFIATVVLILPPFLKIVPIYNIQYVLFWMAALYFSFQPFGTTVSSSFEQPALAKYLGRIIVVFYAIAVLSVPATGLGIIQAIAGLYLDEYRIGLPLSYLVPAGLAVCAAAVAFVVRKSSWPIKHIPVLLILLTTIWWDDAESMDVGTSVTVTIAAFIGFRLLYGILNQTCAQEIRNIAEGLFDGIRNTLPFIMLLSVASLLVGIVTLTGTIQLLQLFL